MTASTTVKLKKGQPVSHASIYAKRKKGIDFSKIVEYYGYLPEPPAKDNNSISQNQK